MAALGVYGVGVIRCENRFYNGLLIGKNVRSLHNLRSRQRPSHAKWVCLDTYAHISLKNAKEIDTNNMKCTAPMPGLALGMPVLALGPPVLALAFWISTCRNGLVVGLNQRDGPGRVVLRCSGI